MHRFLFCIAIILAAISPVIAEGSKILVIGGTGRVGSSVVSKLMSRGIETNVLVRDLERAKQDPKLQGAHLFPGDVGNVDDIVTASRGCIAIISAHGVRPIRYSKLKDLFVHPRHDPNHPYSVNFLGTKRILAAMNINNINRLVRITGSMVGKSAFYPFVAMFNMLLSKTVKWHEQSEIAIRKSGVDYTVIKPPEISSKANATLYDSSSGREVYLRSADDEVKRRGRLSIAVDDLAEICSQAVTDDRLKKASVVCGTIDGQSSGDWNALVSSSNQINPDKKVLKPRKHNLSILVYTAVVGTILSVVFTLLGLFARYVFSKINMALMV